MPGVGAGREGGREQVPSHAKDWPVEFIPTARQTLSFFFFLLCTTFSDGVLVLKISDCIQYSIELGKGTEVPYYSAERKRNNLAPIFSLRVRLVEMLSKIRHQ